jgi:hypothetical protein
MKFNIIQILGIVLVLVAAVCGLSLVAGIIGMQDEWPEGLEYSFYGFILCTAAIAFLASLEEWLESRSTK